MEALKLCATVLAMVAFLGFPPVQGQKCPSSYAKGPHALDCDFDNDNTCEWERVPNLPRKFDLQSGNTPSSFTGPGSDHTTGTGSGKYVYIETSGASDGDKAQLKSKAIDASCKECKLNFWYHMYGSTINKLNVYIVKVGQKMSSTPDWTKSGDQGNKWIAAQMDLAVNAKYQIVIEAVAGSSFTGDIAIDDITLTNCPPRPTPPPPAPCPTRLGPGDCDFEQDSCHCCCWQNQVVGDHNEWGRGRGATPTYGTGPDDDHTYGNSTGHYMYVEASTANTGWSDHGKLISRKLKGVSKAKQCLLTIWYHMAGTNVGNLDIYKRPDNTWIWQQIHLFSHHGHKGKDWHNVTMDLYSVAYSSNDFEISIEASNFDPGKTSSDIAVDDLQFSLGCMFADNKVCDNSAVCTPINVTSKCGTIDPKGPVTGNCDFECGPCFWNNTVCDNFDWFVQEGGTESWGTGPSADHTIGNKEGHYLYIEAGEYWKSKPKGDRAILESPSIRGSTKACTMSLYYHMNGNDIGSLLFYMRTDTRFVLLKTIKGSKGDQWRKTNVTAVSSTDYRIHIIAVTEGGYQGDIAIDDILFTGGGCVFSNRKDNTYCGKSLSSGCADGSREGFFNEQRVAGCRAHWTGERSLRDPPSPPTHHYLNKQCINKACGNKFKDGKSATCNSPADACDTCNGWYVCGSRNPADITFFVNADTCVTASYGHFSAGINHCQRPDGCSVPTGKDYGCTHFNVNCSEPLCCGLGCEKKGCTSGFFPKETAHTKLAEHRGCSRLTSEDAGGVLCCYDPNFVPPTLAPELCATCDFDKNSCGFFDEDNDDFNWDRHSGGTPGWNTGPANDHTTGTPNGHYYYINSNNNQKEGDVAILRSPEYNVTDLSCTACLLEFWYHMWGSSVGTLEVYIEQTLDSDPQSRHPIFHKQGDQGNMWHKASISPLNINSPTFHIIFLATYKGQWNGDTAIDDVQLKDCEDSHDGLSTSEAESASGAYKRTYEPKSVPTTTAPTTEVPVCDTWEFQCASDLSCVQNNKLCNGVNDCPAGEDEANEEPCKTKCTNNFCVNQGTCYVEQGRQKCRCTRNHYGTRCEKTYRTPVPPTVTEAPTTTKPIQKCNPDVDEECWCLDSRDYSRYHHCKSCIQTQQNLGTCVCNRLEQCFPTVEFVKQLVQEEGTYPPEVEIRDEQQKEAANSGDSGSDTGKYAAIGAAIAVVGLVFIAVMAFFIMKQKYATKKAVVGGSGYNGRMTDDAASGVGNPVYSMFNTMPQNPADNIDDDMFAPAKGTDKAANDSNTNAVYATFN